MSSAIPEDSSGGEAGLDAEAQEIVRRFHELYYDTLHNEKSALSIDWLGVSAIKCPFDMWTYQEIIHRLRPDVIVETGSGKGGTTYFMACLCELMGSGRVLSIDHRRPRGPDHPRITYLVGSSVDPGVVEQVRAAIEPDESVMVILDALHIEDHVAAELRTYAPLVSVGHYLIVEDTNVNGHPVYPEHGPGPTEAVEAFLQEPAGQAFEVDRSCERFLLTMNPGGYLTRTRAEQAPG
jgi:cephalosporin hydroxylase